MDSRANPSQAVGCLVVVLRAIAGVFAGLIAGAALNMGIIYAGAALLPPPEGVDVGNIESINANIDKYTVLDMMVPFAAHALGTLLGAFVAAMIAVTARARLRVSLVVGCLFLILGIEAVRMIPNAPLWFDVLDLGLAYIPMALLGWWLAVRK
ncbi:MAG: hypothetical protein RL354_1123 [Planctomycetota bacterium]